MTVSEKRKVLEDYLVSPESDDEIKMLLSLEIMTAQEIRNRQCKSNQRTTIQVNGKAVSISGRFLPFIDD